MAPQGWKKTSDLSVGRNRPPTFSRWTRLFPNALQSAIINPAASLVWRRGRACRMAAGHLATLFREFDDSLHVTADELSIYPLPSEFNPNSQLFLATPLPNIGHQGVPSFCVAVPSRPQPDISPLARQLERRRRRRRAWARGEKCSQTPTTAMEEWRGETTQKSPLLRLTTPPPELKRS